MAVFRFSCLFLLAAVCVAATASAQAPRRNAAAVPSGRQTAPPAQPPAGQVPGMTIAAVVNDEVISVFDLVSRMRMVMISSNIPDSQETRQRIAGQVLRSLIDEKLQLQEAKRQNVTASDSEVNSALQLIEKQNNMQSGQLSNFLKAQNIDRGTLVDQLTASLVWGKLVRRRTAQTTEISDDEIDEAVKRVKEHANEPQSRVAEIFLAVDNPSQEEEVRRLAERLTEQMRKGARFSAVAQQFSKAATAAVGGDIGWVRPDQLAADIGKAVANLRPGELSPPIRTGAGFYLMLVLDRRTGGTGGEQEVVYDIVQVVFPLPASPSEAAKRAAAAEAQSVRAAAKNCPELLKIGKEKAPKLSSEGRLRAREISPEMRSLVAKLGIGEASPPILQKNGVGIIMVCGKQNAAGRGTSREEVTETLVRQRLDTVARRYLRDLRRGAYVDVRV